MHEIKISQTSDLETTHLRLQKLAKRISQRLGGLSASEDVYEGERLRQMNRFAPYVKAFLRGIREFSERTVMLSREEVGAVEAVSSSWTNYLHYHRIRVSCSECALPTRHMQGDNRYVLSALTQA